jgi:hypothetical protein
LTLEHLRIVRVASVAVVIAAMGAGFLGAIYLWRAEWARDSRGRRRLQPSRPYHRIFLPLPDPRRLTPAGRPLYRRGMWLLVSAVAGFGLALILMELYERAP